MSRKKTKDIACADCGAEKPNEARGLCKNCYQRRARVGALDKFPPVIHRLSVGDTCRNGHLIATEGDLIANGLGRVACRECRRETQARHDSKRGRRSAAHTCDRCGIERPTAGVCRDCLEVAQ